MSDDFGREHRILVLTHVATVSDFEVLRPKSRSFWSISFLSFSIRQIYRLLWMHWTTLAGLALITTNLCYQIAPLPLVFVGHSRDYLAFWLLL